MYKYSTSKTEISDGRVDQLWQNNLLRSVGMVLFGLLLNINIHCLLNKISLKLAINFFVVVVVGRHKLQFLMRVIMPCRKDKRNQELKQAAQSCSKITNIFKK